MKLPPYTNKINAFGASGSMSQLQAMLSEKDTVIGAKDTLILEKDSLIAEQIDIIEKKSDVIDSLKQRVELLEDYLRLANNKRFGKSSEQTPPEQGALFNEAETISEPEQAELELPATNAPKAKTGRKPFAKHLARIQVFAYLSDAEKEGAINTFFVKVREELDIIPAKVQVLEYMQEKAVFKDAQGASTMKAADVIKHPVPKAMGSVNLITYIIIAKYADGMPLYRLEGIISRYGGDISRTTLANYVIAMGKQIQPLINLLRETQHAGTLIMADETRIQVLKESGYDPTGEKYMWVTLGGKADQQSVLFDYDPSRGRHVPMRLLHDFKKGYLQSDGCASYNEVCKRNQLVQVGCMDHARRKFIEAQQAQPKGKKINTTKADMALSFINKLYAIERTIKHASQEERLAVRQAQSVPILNKLHAWLVANKPRVATDSLTGRAMTYLHNQWGKLTVYCTDGQLRISNIMAENAIRPFAVGRKAWLFADTPAGAHASAAHYSLIETAKLHGIEPYAYLNAIFKAMPYAETLEDIEALLPWNYKRNITTV
jgi:transposase